MLRPDTLLLLVFAGTLAGGCNEPVNTPVALDLVRPPATAHRTTLVDGKFLAFNGNTTTSLTFDVPEGTTQLHVSAVGVAGESYGPCSWTANGEKLVPKGWNEGSVLVCVGCEVRVTENEHIVAMVAPNRSKPLELAGKHVVELCRFRESFNPDTDPGDGMVVFVDARVGAVPTRGNLELVVVLATEALPGADTAESTGETKAMADRLHTLFDAAGINITAIHWVDAPADMRGKHTDESIGALRRFASDQVPGAVPIAIVDEFQGFLPVLGDTPSLPAPMLCATPQSAVLIDYAAITRSGRDLGRVTAHEIGHFLGMFHTAELIGDGIRDGFDDTPDDDASYLMHPTAKGDTLSPEQAAAMRGSLFVH